jgi:hypothetical protein
LRLFFFGYHDFEIVLCFRLFTPAVDSADALLWLVLLGLAVLDVDAALVVVDDVVVGVNCWCGCFCLLYVISQL